MNAYKRYLAVFDDSKRKMLDRVPTHVQYIREEFIDKYQYLLLDSYKGNLLNNTYFDIPFILGFDSIFAPFSPSYKIKPIKIKEDGIKIIKIGEDGQKIHRKSDFYEGGYIQTLDVLDKLKENLRVINNEGLLKKTINRYDKISQYIFPVLTVDGIFDRVWKSMGMTTFSINFRKKTNLFRELIKFYAKLTQINIEGLIEATATKGKVLNILDDVAFKGRTIISPQDWKHEILPYYKKITAIISDAGMIPQIHTDGDATELIPAFIEAGFRGLQGWEGGCDPFYINDKFPEFVVIGFGDVSFILPYGSKEQIYTHVKDLMDALKENRHFIIGPSTVIFKEIPLKNVTIFMNAIKKFGKY